MFQQSLSLSTIIARLRKLCQEKQTGILYILSKGQLLCQINLQSGKIVFLQAQKKQGIDAIPLVLGIDSANIAFTVGAQPPVHMTLPPTPDILAILEGANLDNTPSQRVRESSHLLLTATAKTILEQALKEFIGPIASLVCADHFRVATNLAAAIDALADEIPDPQAAIQFRERVLQRLS
ncbi:MAG TPA: hypothetical protein PKY50_07015 [Candidatus Competibacter sp.]|nr:hypothetical protein [Candidatus Competibacter sp.]